MKLAIHQPEFMPWPGFFNKMALADLYVVFDHVQFKKRYFDNRNQVVSPRGEVRYIGVPVLSKGRYTQAIRDTEIDAAQAWQESLLGIVRHFYGRAPYFERYFPGLCEAVTAREYHKLIDLNIALIGFLREALGITTPMVYSSAMEVEGFKASDLILKICTLNGADTYLCGASGRDYLKEEDFAKNGVRVEWLEYVCPEYAQSCSPFVPNMSTLDLLLNHGDAALDILMKVPTHEER